MIIEVPLPSNLPSLPLGPHTYTLPTEVPFLCWLLQHTPGNMVEIGCQKGETTLALARTNPDRTIYAIDLPPGQDHHLHPDQHGQIPSPGEACLYARNEPNVEVVLEDSQKIDYLDGRFEDIGVFFIDGDHSYDGVMADTALALLYLHRRGGGLIVWHDYYDAGLSHRVKSFLDTNMLVNRVYHLASSILAFSWIGDHTPGWLLEMDFTTMTRTKEPMPQPQTVTIPLPLFANLLDCLDRQKNLLRYSTPSDRMQDQQTIDEVYQQGMKLLRATSLRGARPFPDSFQVN